MNLSEKVFLWYLGFMAQPHFENSRELLQKEFDVNKAEQLLLQKRIAAMKTLLNDIPSSDPHYSKCAIHIKMDQIEIDELKYRASLLSQQLES